MSIARVTEISATSPNSFDNAVKQGIERANQSLRNVQSAWVKEQTVKVTNGKVENYRVNMMITFVLDD
jgi:dodecin